MGILKGDRIELGTCYYPEHWDESMWEDDLTRMKDTGLNIIRIAEFAWNKFEATEGNFSFDFFDKFLDLCEKYDMKVIFSTPTATPPAWLSEKYPEILNAEKSGLLIRHGERRHYNYNSDIYNEKCKIIVEKIAEHYAQRKCIVGWQIDNEINCEHDLFYSESDDKAFRKWLINKYEVIDKLNSAWGCVFWNQTYTSFDEVHVPRHTNTDTGNPHQNLDYRRFVSDSARRFVKMQSDIIKKYKKEDDFVTTNGMFNLDNHKMNRESLSFYSYDSYPQFAYDENYEERGQGNLLDRSWSRNLSVVRGISEPFAIMEQQSGAGGWTGRMFMPTPKPGQIRLWTMQSIAHGAEYVSYFRWRTSTKGTEIYWHGILDYSGRENRRIKEIKAISSDIKKFSDIAGSKYVAKAAIICTWDNDFDAQDDKWHGMLEETSKDGIYAAATKSHLPIDILYIDEETNFSDISKYELLIFPHALVTEKYQVELLEKYVENGGKLLLGCRAGLKNENGIVTMKDLPGDFANLTGCIVSEFTLASPDDGLIYVVPPKQSKDSGKYRISARTFHDQLELTSEAAKVIGVYDGTYYKGLPAFVKNKFGKGYVYSYGSTFSEDTAAAVFAMMGLSNPYSDYIELPQECELAVRTDGVKTFFFVLNFDRSDVNIKLKKKMRSLLGECTCDGTYTLPAYGVAVFEL